MAGARFTRSYRELNINCAVSEVLPAACQPSKRPLPDYQPPGTVPRPRFGLSESQHDPEGSPRGLVLPRSRLEPSPLRRDPGKLVCLPGLGRPGRGRGEGLSSEEGEGRKVKRIKKRFVS